MVDVTRQDAQKLREFYLAKGLHPVTVKDRVDWVRVLLNYEVEEHGRLTTNPWGREHTFHSFRHGVETILKRAKEPKSHIDRYTGHGGKDIADRDYTHLQAEDLVETASKVLTSGLSLPRVFPIQGWVPPPVPRSILRPKTK